MQNKFGCFKEDGWEYEISTPHTPRPWLNYMGNDNYGVSIAQDGRGYSVNNPPEGSRVTETRSGRFLYLKDSDKHIWSAAYEPVCIEPDEYKCCHGVGYTRFRARKYDISSEMLIFVPMNETMECWNIKLKNLGSSNKTIQLFPYAEWCLAGYTVPWDAYQNYSKCFYDEKHKAVTCVLNDPLYPWISHQGVMVSDDNPLGFDCSKSGFLGKSKDIKKPDSVLNGKCSNKAGSTEECIAALHFEINLKPGEEKEINIIIAYSKNMNKYINTVTDYLKPGNIEKAFNDMKNFWRDKFSALQIETPDPNLDRLINIWLKHQISQANIWCRGGLSRGYRDVMQDLTGIVSFDRKTSLLQLERGLRHQYADGYAPRQFAEEGGPHDTRLYSDSPVWIPYAVNCYIKETGDFDILNKNIEYLEDSIYGINMAHAMSQVTEFLKISEDKSDTLINHALQSMEYMWKMRGEHGLSLILGGDWNDPLNYAGRKGRGESVWLSMIFVFAMKEMAEICDHFGRKPLAYELLNRCSIIKKSINEYAWDGDWYLRAFDDEGHPIGSSTNKFGKIFILSQCWAVISGTAEGDRGVKAMNAVKQHLSTPFGYLTMKPAYKNYDKSTGRISILNPGTFENSAIYCHASSWNMLAELIEGNPDEAYNTYLKMNPYNPNHPSEKSFSEPYVFPNCYFGPEAGERYGQSVMGWLTATSDWVYKIITEWMVGIRPGYEGIIIDPKLPSSWNFVRVIKKIRVCNYEITIKRDKNLIDGTVLVEAGGRKFAGNIIPYFNDDENVKVTVIYK